MSRSHPPAEIRLEDLECVAPFLLAVDERLVVTWASRSILTRVESAVGMNLTDMIESGQTGGNVSRASLDSGSGGSRDLVLRSGESTVLLLGRWVPCRGGHLLLAVPRVRSREELAHFSFEDFPFDDSEVDLLTTRGECAPSLREAAEASTALKGKHRQLEESRQASETQRRAILNMMRDIDESRLRLESVNANLTREISERKRAEEELVRVSRQQRLVLEAAGEGIVGLDAEGDVTFANPAAASMLGWNGHGLVGQCFLDVVEPNLHARDAQSAGEWEIRQRFRQGGRSHIRDETFRTKDGRDLQVEGTFTPIVDGSKVVGAVVTFQDVAERKAMATQRLQSAKLESIGQLAAGIAHEINTPTQYVGDNAHFLRDAFRDLDGVLEAYEKILRTVESGPSADGVLKEVEEVSEKADLAYLREEVPKALEQTLDGVERVSKIVRAMKEFSHPGSGEKTPTDINKLIESTVTVARNEWKYVSDMETDLDSLLPLVPCLPGEFNQVILNIVMNARDAIKDALGDCSGTKGKIRITTRAMEDCVEIRISDTGAGIPQEIRSRILDPFFTTKGVGKGTGQGLAISRSVIVDKHGGTLDFETEVGKGSTFILRLPVTSGVSAAETKPQEAHATPESNDAEQEAGSLRRR